MSDRGRLRVALDKFLKDFNFGELLVNALRILRESDELEFVELLSNLLDVCLEYTKNDPTLARLFADMKARKHQIGAALLSSLGSSVVGGVSGNLLGVLLAKPTSLLNSQIMPALPDPSQMLRQYLYGNWDKQRLYGQLSLHGFQPSYVDDIIAGSKQRIDAPQIFQLLRKYPDRQAELSKMLENRGWNEQDLEWLGALTLQFPSVQDHIQFAVREAYSAEQVKFLGLDRDLPTRAQEEAEKSGLAPGWFPLYWYSHWQLPPLTLGYEFLHRFRHEQGSLKFTSDDLGKLIKALDFSPVWHERMIAASYNTLTRVDIRRMLKARVIDEPRILKEYYKDGYDDNDAQALTDYAIWENAAGMRDLSTAKIGEALKLGIMTELEAQTGLEELRTDPDDIPRQMALWRYEIKKSQIDADVDYLAAQYMNNEIDEQNLRSQLTQLGLSPNNVYVAITNLNAKRKRSVTPLTTGEIYQMFVENIISPVEALTELQIRGVSKINADRQMKLLSIKKQRETDKEVIEQQEKLEKERAKTVQSAKAIELAEVSVSIAELNAETADLKVIYPDLTDIDTITAVDKRLLAIKQEIAYLQLEKTRIDLQFSKELRTNGNA